MTVIGNKNSLHLRQYDIVTCTLTGDYGKPRPAVIVQSDLFNETHASLVLCPITTHLVAAPLFRLLLSPDSSNGLKQKSQIMVDKITSLPRMKINQKIGSLTSEQKHHLDEALCCWLEL